jgi:hypothetical protein
MASSGPSGAALTHGGTLTVPVPPRPARDVDHKRGPEMTKRQPRRDAARSANSALGRLSVAAHLGDPGEGRRSQTG